MITAFGFLASLIITRLLIKAVISNTHSQIWYLTYPKLQISQEQQSANTLATTDSTNDGT